MSKRQQFLQFVNERLAAAALEILGQYEKTVAEECREEICRFKEKIAQQQRALDIQPELQLHRTDVQQLSLPESSYIKEERELWTSKGREQLQELQSDTTDFMLPSVRVKPPSTLDNSSQLPPPDCPGLFVTTPAQSVSMAGEVSLPSPTTSSPAEAVFLSSPVTCSPTATGSTATRPSSRTPITTSKTDVQQLSPAEPLYIKEEPEEWTSLGGEQLGGLQSDGTKFTFSCVTVTTPREMDDSSQPLDQTVESENRDFTDTTEELIKAEFDGEDYKALELANDIQPPSVTPLFHTSAPTLGPADPFRHASTPLNTALLKTTPRTNTTGQHHPLLIQLPMTNRQAGTLVDFPGSSFATVGSFNKAKTATAAFVLKGTPSTATNTSAPTVVTALQASPTLMSRDPFSLARDAYRGGAGGIGTTQPGVPMTTARLPGPSVSMAGAVSLSSTPAASSQTTRESTVPGSPSGTTVPGKQGPFPFQQSDYHPRLATRHRVPHVPTLHRPPPLVLTLGGPSAPNPPTHVMAPSRTTAWWRKKRAMAQEKGEHWGPARKQQQPRVNYLCSKCGQPKRRETGHSRFGFKFFCTAAAGGKTVDEWLAEMRDAKGRGDEH